MFFEPFETTADIFDLINSSSNNTDTKMAAFNQSQNTQPLQHPVSSSSSYQGKLGDSLSTSASGAFFDDYSTDSLNNSSAAIVPDMHAMPLTPEMPRSRLGQQHLQHPPQQPAVKDVVVPKLPAVVQKAKAAAQAAISSPSATAATLSPAATPASTAAGAGTSPRTTRRRRYKYYTPSDDEDDEQAQTPGGADATDDDDSTHSSSSSAKRSAGAGNSRRKAKPVVDLSTLDADEAKAEKNRQSARDCRLRKKKYIQSLEKRLKDAEEREKQLQNRVRSLEFRVLTLQAENVSLQPATCIPSFAAAANNEPMSPTMREALRIVKMDD